MQKYKVDWLAFSVSFEDFRGFYICDGLTNQPLKFYVCDLYSHGFNELGALEKTYKIGFF